MKNNFLVDHDITFLNHGSFGATPKEVFAVYQQWQSRLEEQPVLFLGRQYHQLQRQAVEPLAEYLHTDPRNLVHIPNATHGVNLVARSLTLSPGDEILASDHEYGACDYTWEYLCQKSGAVYKRMHIPLPAESDEVVVEQFWQGVTPNTRLIFISHITSPTALRLPVEAICRRARQAGILTLIDGAHAPGQIPLNLEDLQADFYTGNCHKWMLAPKGVGFLYARQEAQDLLQPLIVSWGYHPDPLTSTGSWFIDLFTWTGTHDPAASLSVPAAIAFMQAHNWPAVQTDCHQLLVDYLPKFTDLTGYPAIYTQPHQFSQMAAVRLPLLKDLPAMKSALYDQYKIEVPLIEWDKQHFLRISVQAYNTKEDLDKLLFALDKLLPLQRKWSPAI